MESICLHHTMKLRHVLFCAFPALLIFFSLCSPPSFAEDKPAGEGVQEKAPLWGLDFGEDLGPAETAIEGKAAVPGLLVYPSPDKRYAISWPLRDEAEKENFEVTNHLVDLQSGQSVGKIADGDGDFEGRNHGGMRILWRQDSRALVYRLEGKWAPRGVAVMEIDPAGRIRETSLTQSVAAAFAALLAQKAPAIWGNPEGEPSEYLGCNIGCAFDPQGTGLMIEAEFEMNPKQIPGQTYAAGRLTGSFDMETGKLTVISQELTAALAVKEEE